MGTHPRDRARRDAARGGRAAAGAHGRAGARNDARGRQAAAGELRRGRMDGGRVRLLRRDRPQQRGPRDPLDRVDSARPGAEGADGRGGLHRALELPAAAAGVEARAGSGRRQHHGLQALRADAAVDADARGLLRPPPRRRREPDRGRGRRRRGDHPRRARRLRGVHRLGRDRQARRGRLRAAGRARQPRDGRQGPVHRVLRRRRRDRRGG